MLVLLLGLAAYSFGTPIERKKSLLWNMLYICDDDPNLVELVSETKMAYVSIDESFYLTTNTYLAKGSLRYCYFIVLVLVIHLRHYIRAEEILQNLSANAIVIKL